MKYERVWDPLVRIFHWALVAAFATAWWERGEAIIHETAGKIVLGLVIFRAVWGLVGPHSARFENFVKGVRATFAYVVSILRGRPQHYVGHNPAGAAMIALMLLALVTTAASGILMTTTAMWGNSWIEWIHGTSANVMLVLISGHLLGILVAAIQHRENLVWSMITGWKWVPQITEPYLGDLKIGFKSVTLALVVLGLSVGIWKGSQSLLNASAWRMQKLILAELNKAGCSDAKVLGPRIEVYPDVRLVYDIKSGNSKTGQALYVSAHLALQKRPAVDVKSIANGCAVDAIQPSGDMGSIVTKPENNSPFTLGFGSTVIPIVPVLPPVSTLRPMAFGETFGRVRSATELAAIQIPEVLSLQGNSRDLSESEESSLSSNSQGIEQDEPVALPNDPSTQLVGFEISDDSIAPTLPTSTPVEPAIMKLHLRSAIEIVSTHTFKPQIVLIADDKFDQDPSAPNRFLQLLSAGETKVPLIPEVPFKPKTSDQFLEADNNTVVAAKLSTKKVRIFKKKRVPNIFQKQAKSSLRKAEPRKRIAVKSKLKRKKVVKKRRDRDHREFGNFRTPNKRDDDNDDNGGHKSSDGDDSDTRDRSGSNSGHGGGDSDD